MAAGDVGGGNFVVGFNADVVSAIQDHTLQRTFHDTLFPLLMYRGEADAEEWPTNLGATQTFTRAGTMRPSTRPLRQHRDPTPKSWELEQWGDAVDTHMPTSYVTLASLFLRNVQNLGLHAGQSMNRVVRDKMFNAYLAGNTVVKTGGVGAGVSIPVVSLNGFTRKLFQGRPAIVSAANPLEITIISGGIPQTQLVIGFVSDFDGDEIHGGTLTLQAPGIAAPLNARDIVIAENASEIVRSGGGLSIDQVTASDHFTMNEIRIAVSQLRTNLVPPHPDGTFHCHLDPTSEAQIFGDTEFQSMTRGALPEYVAFREFTVAFLLGTSYLRNNEAPVAATVDQDPEFGFTFAGELQNTPVAGNPVQIHRPIFTGFGCIEEKFLDESKYISEAGVIGKIGEFAIMNNGMQVLTERIRLILRAPMDRLQQLTSAAWSFSGGWGIPTDALSKTSSADYKRAVIVEHGA